MVWNVVVYLQTKLSLTLLRYQLVFFQQAKAIATILNFEKWRISTFYHF